MIALSFSSNAYIDKHLNLLNCCTLEILFNWFKNNSKLNNLIVYENDIYQWFNLNVLAEYCKCSWKTMQNNISTLCELGFLKKFKTKDNKLYLTIDFEKYKTALNFNEELVCKRINWINKYLEIEKDKKIKIIETYNKTSEEKKVAGLLDDEEMQVAKPKYCKQADAIARKILNKYAQYFSTKYPKEGEEPTKTYIRLCNKITDIYNGHFISSRFYEINENVFNNKQFDTEGWQDKIKAVKNDWTKTKQLIFQAVENFVLMYDEDRMPMNKTYLTNNLNNWFFSDDPNNKGQSQFIQSLNEPMVVKQKLSLDKAKVIVEEIKLKSPVSYYAGHELNELLPVNANEASAWTLIQDIIKWGKLLFQFDENAKYFFQCEINEKLESGPKVLPALFARYLKENNISVSLNTLNIKQSIDSNAPWCWFINEACKKHNLNPDCVQCLDDADFFDAYNKGITFDEMEEIVF